VILTAVDPGKWLFALARFDGGLLVEAELRRYTKYVECRVAPCDRLVCEWPTVYPGSRAEDPNDLLPLTACVGAVAALTQASSFSTLAPREWTSGRPKDVNHRRILKRLSPAEQGVLDAGLAPVEKNLRHNVLDAVGIGLYALDRL
jgi:hypothetical protein